MKEATAPMTTRPPIAPPTITPVLLGLEFEDGGVWLRGAAEAPGVSEDVGNDVVFVALEEREEEEVKPFHVRSTVAVPGLAAHPHSLNVVVLAVE
jgi:hypothetical protein